MRHALAANWIPPLPARRKAPPGPLAAMLREASLAAALACALSWGLAEVMLLLLG
jgi:hypothetical protein